MWMSPFGGRFDPVLGIPGAQREELLIGERGASRLEHGGGELLELVHQQLHQSEFIAGVAFKFGGGRETRTPDLRIMRPSL